MVRLGSEPWNTIYLSFLCGATPWRTGTSAASLPPALSLLRCWPDPLLSVLHWPVSAYFLWFPFQPKKKKKKKAVHAWSTRVRENPKITQEALLLFFVLINCVNHHQCHLGHILFWIFKNFCFSVYKLHDWLSFGTTLILKWCAWKGR